MLADEKSQLPVASSLESLSSLLASSRSNEDIQLELVEILGFEGAGLQLVEELLRPGNRAAVLEELGDTSGDGHKVSRALVATL